MRRKRYVKYGEALHRFPNLLNRNFAAERPNQKWVTDISQAHFKLTQQYGIIPSMSRRGNPYDNALAENFFSILKTECIHRVKIKTFAEARRIIDDYIFFYNHQRIQTKTKLTPMEFRRQYVA